jgi:anti-sigma-K factor RskA
MHPSPDILALLALGEAAGTPAERDHVESCAQCRSEVADLARTVAVGRESTAETSGLVRPSDRVWEAIQTELGFDSAGSAHGGEVASVTALPQRETSRHQSDATESGLPVAAIQAGKAPGQSRGRRVLALALAAAVALVAGIGLGFGLDRLVGPRQTILWTAELQALPAYSGSRGEAVVEQDAEGNRTLVIEVSSSRPVDGSQEVWLIDRSIQQMRSLGHLTPSSNRFGIPADLDPRQFPVVDVSAEPPKDIDTRHSGISIVRGTLNV